ncbi:MAG: hypothetical protein HOV81_13675 [Kofleriaceae bacterium]|nr:hypothetical protein [Kofleriaceae bacterium]
MNTAERLLTTIDWSRLHAIADANGDGIRSALADLLASDSPESAERAYWRIENHAFAQHDLFEVAEACTSVLIASLLDPRERWVRIAVLELLFWILGGYASPSASTPPDIRERCHAVAREGLWLLIREAIGEHRDAALEVLNHLGEQERAWRLIELG